jgi:molybdopterin/thiamine biosynthesis adenylyltransferase
MINQELFYNRQIQLWGEEKQSLLKDKTIAIIGCGGLGCSLGIALGASGIGKIYLVDFDTVSVHNIHRQIALKLSDEGRFKADVLAETIKSRSPFVEVVTIKTSFDEFAKSLPKVDLIIDATDNLPTRKKINDSAKSHNTPWLYGSVEGWNGQVCFFDRSDFGVFAISDRKPGGIAAPIVMMIASFQANLALRYLLDMAICKDTLYYFYFNEQGEFVKQHYEMPLKENE